MLKKFEGKALVLICLIIFTAVPAAVYGDNANVLPKGVSMASVSYVPYFTIKERYNSKGETEPAAIDYNQNLNPGVFSDLSAVEAAFNLTPGSASLGNSIVSFKYDYTEIFFNYMYGLTDKLSFGIKIPYIMYKNNVSASLDTSSATVGKSANGVGLGAPLVPFNCAICIPDLGPFGDAQKLTKEDILDLISNGLDVNGDGIVDVAGFGYKRFGTIKENGIGDIQIGLRYQYLKTEDFRLAFTGGIKLPTGEVNDPDNLVDMGFGNGAYALLFQSQNDYVGFDKLKLNATFEYDLVLPADEELRVPTDVALPITSNKEKVDRDIGDFFRFGTSASYNMMEGLSTTLQYKFTYKFKNSVKGDQGLPYETLEKETDLVHHDIMAGLSYSTLHLYKEKKFPLPMNFSVLYEKIFKAKNILKQSDIAFTVSAYF